MTGLRHAHAPGCNLFEADIFRIEAQQRFTESRESPKPITEHSAVRAYREELLGHEPPLFPRLRRLRHPDEPAIEALNGQRPDPAHTLGGRHTSREPLIRIGQAGKQGFHGALPFRPLAFRQP